MIRKTIIYIALLVGLPWPGGNNNIQAQEALARSLLAPVRTDSPRDTMRSFMEKMEQYRIGLQNEDPDYMENLDDAVRTLNLENIPFVTREEKGRESAIYLKEVIDRVIKIDYSLIPDETVIGGEILHRWRLKDTEIIISRVTEGERAGEYLFSPDTVSRSAIFYEKVKDLPYAEGVGKGAGFRKNWIEQYTPLWAGKEFLDIHLWQWVGIFAAILLGLFVRTTTGFFLFILLRIASRSAAAWDDRIIKMGKGPVELLAGTAVWYVAIRFLQLEGNALAILNFTVKILISIGLIWLAYRAVNEITEYFNRFAAKTTSSLDDHLVPLLNRTLRIFTVLFGVLMAVQNMGINVMSLIAGLGIGGIAFALAAKDTVANFFGSMMILFDSPFQVGDWVVLGDQEGTVEEIGFRSTRIRTFYNSQLTIPNSDLMNARIDNMGRRTYRRIRTDLSLTYDTSPEKLEAFLEGIKNIIEANPHTRKDYYHIVFKEFGADGLIVMLYAFLKVPDWATELVERQNVYLEILRLASDIGVEFAFPTQTVHVESFPEKTPTRIPDPGRKEELKKLVKEYGPGMPKSSPSGRGIFTPPYANDSKQS